MTILCMRRRKETFTTTMVVTFFLDGTGMLLKHRDYDGPARLPLIQCWVLLSEPGADYTDGNLVIHARSGRAVRVEADLGLEKGDALVFDKSLWHEVEPTGVCNAPDAQGRWTLVIGARAQRDSFRQAQYKRWAFGRYVYPARTKLMGLGGVVRRSLRRAGRGR